MMIIIMIIMTINHNHDNHNNQNTNDSNNHNNDDNTSNTNYNNHDYNKIIMIINRGPRALERRRRGLGVAAKKLIKFIRNLKYVL